MTHIFKRPDKWKRKLKQVIMYLNFNLFELKPIHNLEKFIKVDIFLLYCG